MGEPSDDVRRDALLACLVLGVFLALGVVLDATISPLAGALGALATIALEWIAGRHERRVRQVWARRDVEFVAVVIVLGAGTALGLLVPAPIVSFAVAALTTYLALLVLVRWNVLPPPSAWG